MLSLFPVPNCLVPSGKVFQSSPSLFVFIFSSRSCSLLSSRVSSIARASSGISIPDEKPRSNGGQRAYNAGLKLEETVDIKTAKLRLDSWISSRVHGVSRARVQSSIRLGLVTVNGRVVDKVSHNVKDGDKVRCTLSEPQPLKAEPEDIPLNVVFEDEHVLVINKPAHMVVHPAPGNPTGTLVNGILHHCCLPTVAYSNPEADSDEENISGDKELSSNAHAASVRPGIVHRLDKGTSGLLVVAKSEHSHAHLAEQFKLRSIERAYISLTSGVPSPYSGRVNIPIGRDMNNRVRMAAISGSNSRGRARHAASRYKVIEILAGGASALVEWILETGRTHQIRAHAKHMGVPLLGDEVYGGTKNMALSLLQTRVSSGHHRDLLELVSRLDRPCLHAMTLGFKHPYTGEYKRFSCPPPLDFTEILGQLSRIGTEKVE